jgi:iron complex transport system ATP-binding protein
MREGDRTPEPMEIRGQELTVRYPGQPNPALEGVDVHVAPGQFHAVVGPNGSGKSSLMRALLGMVPLAGGTVLLGGRPLATWNRRDLAQEIGAVSQQEPVSFPIRVREMVEMGRYPHLGPLASPSPADDALVHEAMARCQVLDLAHRQVETLSGGEHQRVRIARALAQEPRALLLDEPTASLDIRHEMGIFQLLRAEADRGMAVLVITHHLDMAARFADTLLLLGCGRTAAVGPAEAVLQPTTLEQVYGWPVAVRTDEVTGSPRIIPLA